MSERASRVVVIGAGVTGLVAGYRIARLFEHAGRPLELHVLDAADRVGGTIDTFMHDGCTLERGADAMITEKPAGVELCREIGLGDALIPTNGAFQRRFIVRGKRLVAVPEGFHLMAPSRAWPFLASPLLSWPGKVRVALEPLVPRRPADAPEESLAEFVRRRLGREMLERVAQPMVGGIYTADPERLSLRATMPRFLDMEREHGSIVRGLVAARHRQSAIATASGPRYQLFVSLAGGMGTLTARLRELLPDSALRLGVTVRSLARDSEKWSVATDREQLAADAICIAVPAYRAAQLLGGVSPELARELSEIPYASTATVALAYRRNDIDHPLDGFGFVVPAVEGKTTLACTFVSTKFPSRARQGIALLRAFVGGAMFPERFELADDAMVAAVTSELTPLLGIRGQPLWTSVTKMERSMPQYHVGHLERVSRIDALVDRLPGVALAGNAYRGTGIPDCIQSGTQAALRLRDALCLNAIHHDENPLADSRYQR